MSSGWAGCGDYTNGGDCYALLTIFGRLIRRVDRCVDSQNWATGYDLRFSFGAQTRAGRGPR
jgi:hypothetical protein